MKLRAWEEAQKDRRKLLRAPVMTRVHIDGQEHMLACDVSTRGLRCSGRPKKSTLDVEFKIPGLPFPIDAKAEVIEYCSSRCTHSLNDVVLAGNETAAPLRSW